MNTITTHRVISCGIQTFGLVLCIVLTVVASRIPGWIPRVMSIVTGIVALLLLFFHETRIDIRKGIVTEVCKLLRFVSVWQRQREFNQFRGIAVYCSSDGESDDISSTWQVALQPHLGSSIDIRQFSSPPGKESPNAQAFARELSHATGLEVIDYVAGPGAPPYRGAAKPVGNSRATKKPPSVS